MKTPLVILVLSSVLALPGPGQVAQTGTVPSPGADNSTYTVTERGPHHKVWSRTEWRVGPAGKPISRVHSFTELATGMHLLQNGKWVETSEKIELLPGGIGAAATNGPHQVLFPADIYEGVIETIGPDGTHLRSRPSLISYFDGTNNFTIAELTNSIGQILPSGNQVIYTNCFSGVSADMLITYRRSGVEC